MKFKMYCVGLDFSIDGSVFNKISKSFGSIGVKLAAGLYAEFQTTMFRRIFVISNPTEVSRMESGLRASMMMMQDVEVSDPPKSFGFVDINNNLTDLELINRNGRVVDVKFTICDQLNQPQYTIEKFNVPYEGVMTSEFNIRGELQAVGTFYKVPKNPLNKKR